jgi:hypothetical protein
MTELGGVFGLPPIIAGVEGGAQKVTSSERSRRVLCGKWVLLFDLRPSVFVIGAVVWLQTVNCEPSGAAPQRCGEWVLVFDLRQSALIGGSPVF